MLEEILRTTSGDHFFMWLFFLGYGTIHGFWSWWRCFRRARMLKDTATSTVRAAAQGMIELKGQAKVGPVPIISPFTDLPCAWYRITVEQSNGDKGYKVIYQQTSSQMFYLDDGTGECLIDPDGAEMVVRRRDVWYGNTSQLQGIADIITGRQKQGFLSKLSRNYRYTQQVVELNYPVYVLGLFNTMRICHEREKKDKVGEIVRQWKQEYDKLLAEFDKNGDGQLDMQEWQAVLDAAHEQAQQHFADEVAGETQLDMVVAPKVKGQRFVISDYTEDEIIKRDRRKSIFGLLAFFVCGASLVFMLSARF